MHRVWMESGDLVKKGRDAKLRIVRLLFGGTAGMLLRIQLGNEYFLGMFFRLQDGLK